MANIITGLVGMPIKKSESPAMHNFAFKETGISGEYFLFETEEADFERRIEQLRRDAIGFNITMPYKERVGKYMDIISPEADLSGAINTVVSKNGSLIGYNTDGKGFTKAVREKGFTIEGKNILILGAGGGAKGIACQLALEGAAQIVILNRTPEKARNIKDRIDNLTLVKYGELNGENCESFSSDTDIIVNATPVGSYGMEGKSSTEGMNIFRKGILVADLIYNPDKTRFLREAEEAGAVIMNGRDMLINQGALAFELWTGKKFPIKKWKEKFYNSK